MDGSNKCQELWYGEARKGWSGGSVKRFDGMKHKGEGVGGAEGGG